MYGFVQLVQSSLTDGCVTEVQMQVLRGVSTGGRK
jgi:hypothetical protein